MSVGQTRGIALIGLAGITVEIQADIASGLPRFAIVGLPDRSLAESTDRVRSAIVNSGLSMPSQRVTVNLSPAGLPKAGAGFDLGVAIAALAASAQISRESAQSCVHIGELALDGRLRPTQGILPAVLGARQAGASAVIVPSSNRDEAALVDGIRVVGLATLRDVAIWHGAKLEPIESEVALESQGALGLSGKVAGADVEGDISDVVGNREAVDALIVAAAGGHHFSMIGPPGAGKTMLATRLVGLLPDLDPEQSLDVACVRSLVGHGPMTSLPMRPPFEAPHHTATTTSLVGGGSGVIKPGSIARATHGVLFLDETPEFSASTLDALRQPLETGSITIHRAQMTASFPARFQLVLAANPCPCGLFGVADAECVCPSLARRRYLARLSGPLRDRIDIHLAVARVTNMISTRDDNTLTTAQARHVVDQARRAATQRWEGTGIRINAHVPGGVLRSAAFRLPSAVSAPLDKAIARTSITARGYDRALRLAWTLSDLDGATSPRLDHVGRALLLRRGTFA